VETRRLAPRGYPVALLLLIVALFLRATGGGFINLDDPEYVAAVPEARQGLSREGLRWAFLDPTAAMWIPLSRLSALVDVELYGLRPGGHHLTSVLLHAANGVLVLLVLRRMTGDPARSLAAAVLFAVHPLRVESVAWVAERKDVLSGFFTLLALYAYAGWARAPGAARLAGTTGLYLLALLAKPMAVTFPALLLLLDYWPLRRLASVRDLWPRVREKWPLVGLATAFAMLTLHLASSGGAMLSLADASPRGRLATSAMGYTAYLRRTFWPTGLSVFYPLPPAPEPAWQVALAALVLVTLTVIAVRHRARQPYLLVGWLWFGAAILPVGGLMQAGSQATADRFTYLPSVGLAVAVVWGAGDLARRAGIPARATTAAVAVVACALATRTWQQLGHWRDTKTLFSEALRVSEDNWLAHGNLGDALVREGRVAEGQAHFETAVRLMPRYADGHYNLGVAHALQGRMDQAIAELRVAIALDPRRASAHYNLGLALYKRRDPTAAAAAFRHALLLDPRHAEAHYGLGLALAAQGDASGARRHFADAQRLDPRLAPPGA
jgi:protein O-mannosyl-transferase